MRHSPHQLISGGGKPPYQGPSCNSEGAGSKEVGTHLLRGVLQPCDEPVTHPPWIGMFLSFVVFKLRSEISNYPSSPFIGGNTKLLANLTVMKRLPAITLFTDFARDGGLMAYGPTLLSYIRQEGIMAARILQGARPDETPIERPTKFEFVLNIRTA